MAGARSVVRGGLRVWTIFSALSCAPHYSTKRRSNSSAKPKQTSNTTFPRRGIITQSSSNPSPREPCPPGRMPLHQPRSGRAAFCPDAGEASFPHSRRTRYLLSLFPLLVFRVSTQHRSWNKWATNALPFSRSLAPCPLVPQPSPRAHVPRRGCRRQVGHLPGMYISAYIRGASRVSPTTGQETRRRLRVSHKSNQQPRSLLPKDDGRSGEWRRC